MYKLLAVDLDGTLVRGDGAVEQRDRAAVAALMQHGIPVAIVTGRLYGATRPVAAELGLSGPHVCVDGAVVVAYPGDDEIYHAGIAGAAADAVRGALSRDGLAALAIVDDAVVLDAKSAPFERQVRHMSPNIEHVSDVLEHRGWITPRGMAAVVAIGLTEVIVEAQQALPDELALDIVRHDLPRGSGVSTLVLHARGVSKGTGLQQLAQHYGCGLGEVVAVGDWHNDVPMFEVAGRSFAMAGAPEDVCRAASQVLASDVLHGGGIAEVVHIAWPGLLT